MTVGFIKNFSFKFNTVLITWQLKTLLGALFCIGSLNIVVAKIGTETGQLQTIDQAGKNVFASIYFRAWYFFQF